MEKDVLMVSFSGGRSSAYMTDKVLKGHKYDEVVVCFANTGKESPETLDFVDECDRYWGGVVQWLEYDAAARLRVVDYASASRGGEPYAALIARRGFLPNVVWRFCTQELKIRVIKRYMMSIGFKHWTNAVGIRYDEPARWARTRAIGERERWDTWLPLVDWKVTKPMVLEYWRGMPFDLRLPDYKGNCDLCFLKGRNKWRRLLAADPGLAEWWIEQERLTGGTFRKELSVSRFLEMVRTSPQLFDYEDPDVACFCNSD